VDVSLVLQADSSYAQEEAHVAGEAELRRA
jgi:hypothetical protein